MDGLANTEARRSVVTVPPGKTRPPTPTVELDQRMGGLPLPVELVESYFVGVRVDRSRREVQLTFRLRSEYEIRLLARGVEKLLVNELLEQNIVHEVRVSGSETAPDDIEELLAEWLLPSGPDALDDARLVELEACTAAVHDGRKILLEIEAVYGATVLLLAESVEWLDPFPA
jgi:hypothetical protein